MAASEKEIIGKEAKGGKGKDRASESDAVGAAHLAEPDAGGR